MKLLAFCVLLAAAGVAAAQAPAPAPAPEPSPAKSPERPALKLQLDEPVRASPRITFAPREGKSEQRPASVLPELGGKPDQALERAPSEVVPKGSLPGI
jgi:hypothetical protein